jgi:O-6-methylguanine DNA methyltransferase
VSTTPTDIVADLRSLRRPAPADLRHRILEAAGLGEHAAVVDGPAGRLWIAFTARGVSAVVPLAVAADIHDLGDYLGRRVTERPLPQALAASVARALRTGKVGAVPLDLSGLTDFQRAVLTTTARIPPGEMRPYRWVAREIGRPKATRAVGSALAGNPIPVLLPCHRVARSDGSIGNYAFGAPMKRALLAAEGLDLAIVDDAAGRGVRYVASRTTDVYCHPTCRHARRITDENRQEFATAAAAVDAGRRPCSSCRPMAA